MSLLGQSLVIATGRLAEEAAEHELPIPPYAFALIALGIFIASFLVTFAFRNAANRHNPAAFRAHDTGHEVGGGSGHKSIGSGH